MLKIDRKSLTYLYSLLRKRMVHLNLQLLYNCNYKCKICNFWKHEYDDAPKLSLDQVQIIADKIKFFGPQIISIGGGEPLLHNDIIPITKTLAKDNFPVMICNGWFITPEIAKDLFNAGMYEVSISVDYANPNQHDKQRGKQGAFDRAIEALEILQKSRTQSFQRVHMISVVMEDNLCQIEELIKLAKEIGITYLVTLYSDNRGRKDKPNLSTDVSSHLLDLKKKYKEFLSLPGYISKFSESLHSQTGIQPCFAGKNLYNIDSTGNVSQCIDKIDQLVGNIFTEDIREIENRLLQLQSHQICGDCWTSCRGAIETLMYKGGFSNWKTMYQSIKNVPLSK